ncbi:MAG: aldo/keto reductase [Brevundimonas sp.]|uniref:aldo/keto reductase n=1 Tax=Brevundimonas sp. TaxID=1871086 RepID=UPI0024892242|nr:aldo/keto reductase [Brevundimonas sp.]MDI1325312.1 aldo/keto reductase [Brevundimonas sp.]
MIPNRAPIPVDKLALAVVHAPDRAIPAPAGAREESLRFLLQTAADSGVTRVATRPDGDGERWLGQSWPFPSPFQVSVRTVPVSDGVDRVEARARRSLERLGLPRGDALLVSSASDLAGTEGRALWDKLLALKDRGLYRRIGFCASVEDGPALLARRFQPDVVQLKCNLLDQRAQRTGVLSELAALDVTVHASSIFADGLLFMNSEALPVEMHRHGPTLSRIRRRLAEARVDPMQATLAYALGLPEVTAVVASVASAAELRAVVAAAHAPTPALDWASMQLEPATATAAGPNPRGLGRISSAA